MSIKKLLYVFTQAPYSKASGQEALDAVLIGASFEQKVSVLFMHDGIFQLKTNQSASESELKAFTKAYRALEDFGIERVCVHSLSLLARGVSKEELMVESDILDSIQVSALIAQQDRVFTF